MLRARARFPEVPAGRAHYESFYLKACHPDGGLAVWIRHTVFKPAGATPIGSVWVTLFDAERGPVALKQRFLPEQLTAPADAYISIGDAVLASDRLAGRVRANDTSAAWELRFAEVGNAPAFPYLPRSWMYRTPLPRTKPVLLFPAISVSGDLAIGSRRITVDGWPGLIGHNWGSEHPRRGCWIHGTGFAEQPDARIDVVLGRIALGPVLTPWVGGGVFVIDGRAHRLGGARPGASRLHDAHTGARFVLRGADLTVSGTVSAPRTRFIGWRYSDPSTGSWHPTLHCSVADMELSVSGPGALTRTLTLAGGAAYELQLAEHDHGVPLQPFPDP